MLTLSREKKLLVFHLFNVVVSVFYCILNFFSFPVFLHDPFNDPCPSASQPSCNHSIINPPTKIAHLGCGFCLIHVYMLFVLLSNQEFYFILSSHLVASHGCNSWILKSLASIFCNILLNKVFSATHLLCYKIICILITETHWFFFWQK